MLKKITGLFLCILLSSVGASAQFRPSPEGIKLERTLQLIKNLYVDDVDSKELTESAVRAMLRELDPHSSYLNEEEVKAMNEPLQGNFDGIGISFNMLTDTLYVMEVIAGGPSQKVGILPGDKIIYVGDTLIAGVEMNNQDVVKMLRGPKGTTVNVKVLRRGSKDLIEFRIVRDKIPITSIDAAYMVSENIGYIRLSRFGISSADEFKAAESKLRSQGMKHLLLDLTDNGGGILQTANEIADEFLGEGKVIVYTEGKNQPRYTMNATGTDELNGGKLVILVNGSSASASEILAGAIQDWDRGVIVGRRTFGKGLVQRQLPLPDGTMIRLTVARYYTPSGRSIQMCLIESIKVTPRQMRISHQHSVARFRFQRSNRIRIRSGYSCTLHIFQLVITCNQITNSQKLNIDNPLAVSQNINGCQWQKTPVYHINLIRMSRCIVVQPLHKSIQKQFFITLKTSILSSSFSRQII
jgi:carboxyl-terminal processing protease